MNAQEKGRVDHTADQPDLSACFDKLMSAHGVTRRDFTKLCTSVALAAGLSSSFIPRIAQALEKSVIGATEGNLYPVIWLEGASCTGCTEAFGQVDTPDPARVILEMISLNYSETFSAAAGHSMEEARHQTIEAGNYLVVYEGAILKAFDGYALRVAGETGIEYLADTLRNANALVALGSCAVNGGWMAAQPAAVGAMGCQEFIKEQGIDIPVINIPGCPANPEWLVAVLVDVVLMNTLPELNAQNMPSLIFDQCVHDNCPRRGHFENGEFVYEFGSEEEKKGYCLYPLGCRGPQTKANCPIVRYNHRRSWCIEAGAPCIGCCCADPENSANNWVDMNTPFSDRLSSIKAGNAQIDPFLTGAGVAALAAACLGLHGVGMKRTGRCKEGAPFEEKRAWDVKHPDRAIGIYDDDSACEKEHN